MTKAKKDLPEEEQKLSATLGASDLLWYINAVDALVNDIIPAMHKGVLAPLSAKYEQVHSENPDGQGIILSGYEEAHRALSFAYQRLAAKQDQFSVIKEKLLHQKADYDAEHCFVV